MTLYYNLQKQAKEGLKLQKALEKMTRKLIFF